MIALLDQPKQTRIGSTKAEKAEDSAAHATCWAAARQATVGPKDGGAAAPGIRDIAAIVGTPGAAVCHTRVSAGSPLRENARVPSSDSPDSFPPIVFVHGNGDTAGLWFTTVWRFESNGWPRDRLHAIALPHPLARDDEQTPQPGRTSSAEHMAFLAAEVERVRAATG